MRRCTGAFAIPPHGSARIGSRSYAGGHSFAPPPEDDHDTLYNDSTGIRLTGRKCCRHGGVPIAAGDNGLAAGGCGSGSAGAGRVRQHGSRSNCDPASGNARINLGALRRAAPPRSSWPAIPRHLSPVSTVPFGPGSRRVTAGAATRRTGPGWSISLSHGLQNVLILSGDCHWGSIDDGTHRSPELNVPKTTTASPTPARTSRSNGR
jgi:hypothetical protein